MAGKLIKNAHDILGIRHSCHTLAAIFRELTADIKSGLTTAELEQRACLLIERAGGRPAFKNYQGRPGDRPFPTALCTSVNQVIVHGPALPSRTLRAGDIIGIDVGMDLNGYYSDMAATFAVGKISAAARHLLRVTQHSLQLGIDQIKPGNSLNDIGTTIQNYVEGEGLAVIRDLVGHGVGLEVHEEPQIPHCAIADSGLPDLILKPGMVLAIEPMVSMGTWKIKTAADHYGLETADGELSAHFEHTVLVTVNGHEILTQ